MLSTEDKGMFACLGAIVLIVAIVVAIGWIFQIGWLWVIVPIFNASPLTLGQAIGLILFLMFVGSVVGK